MPDAPVSASVQTARPASSWWLRLPGGVVFGPTDLPTLRAWAEQRRVAPGHEVSADNLRWVRAETVPDLEMVWNVELPDGTFYGPLNLKAMADLLEDGTITPRARLINVRTRAESDVASQRDAIAGTTAAAPQPAPPPPSAASVSAAAQPPSPPPPGAERLDRLEQALATLLDERTSWRRTTDESLRRLHEQVETRLASVTAQAERIQQSLESERARLEALAGDLTEARRQMEPLPRLLAAHTTRADDVAARLQATVAEVRSRQQGIENGQAALREEIAAATQRQFDAATRDLGQQFERQQTEARQALDRQTERLESRLQTAQEALAAREQAWRARLAEVGENLRATQTLAESLRAAHTAFPNQLALLAERQRLQENAWQEQVQTGRRLDTLARSLNERVADLQRDHQAQETARQDRATEIKRLMEETAARHEQLAQQVLALNRRIQDGAATETATLRDQTRQELADLRANLGASLGDLGRRLADLRQSVEDIQARGQTRALDDSRWQEQSNAALKTTGARLEAHEEELARLRRDLAALQSAWRERRDEPAPAPRPAAVIDVEALGDARTPRPPPRPAPAAEPPRGGQNLREIEEQAARELRLWQEARRRMKPDRK